MLLLLLLLLAMLSSWSRLSLSWTCVNVCRDRSNGDARPRHAGVHVQVPLMLHRMVHACPKGTSVIAPAAVLRRRAAVAVRNLRSSGRFHCSSHSLARASCSLDNLDAMRTSHRAACICLAGAVRKAVQRLLVQYVDTLYVQHSTTRTIACIALHAPRSGQPDFCDCLQLGAS